MLFYEDYVRAEENQFFIWNEYTSIRISIFYNMRCCCCCLSLIRDSNEHQRIYFMGTYIHVLSTNVLWNERKRLHENNVSTHKELCDSFDVKCVLYVWKIGILYMLSLPIYNCSDFFFSSTTRRRYIILFCVSIWLYARMPELHLTDDFLFARNRLQILYFHLFIIDVINFASVSCCNSFTFKFINNFHRKQPFHCGHVTTLADREYESFWTSGHGIEHWT